MPSTRTARTGSGPHAATASASDGPGTNAVASHGASASASAPSTGTTQELSTRPAQAASRRNRARNSGCSANSGWITFTAASSPAPVRAR